MTKLGWVELETLSTEAAHLQSRIEAARASRNHGKVRLLEREMTELTERRNRVLADITNGLGDGALAGQQPGNIPVQDTQPKRPGERQRNACDPTSTEPAQAVTTIGGIGMWDKLTVADLERVKRELGTRRSEMLARHAEELKGLEADRREIDAIEQAIGIFTQNFKFSKTAEVLVLETEWALAPAG